MMQMIIEQPQTLGQARCTISSLNGHSMLERSSQALKSCADLRNAAACKKNNIQTDNLEALLLLTAILQGSLSQECLRCLMSSSVLQSLRPKEAIAVVDVAVRAVLGQGPLSTGWATTLFRLKLSVTDSRMRVAFSALTSLRSWIISAASCVRICTARPEQLSTCAWTTQGKTSLAQPVS